MATRVVVAVDQAQLARVRRVLSSLRAPKLHTVMGNFLKEAAYSVLKDAAENQIIRGGQFRGPAGPRGGKGKLRATKPHPTKLTSRSGELRRSLSVARGSDTSGLPRYVEVGTSARSKSGFPYPVVHELGLRGFPPRPFLQPAVDAVSPRFELMLLTELEKAVTKAAGS